MKNLDEQRFLAKAFEAGRDCFPVETLAALECGELHETEAVRVRRHAAECPRCTAEIELAESFRTAAVQPAEAADVAWIEARLGGREQSSATERPVGLWDRVRSWFAISPGGLALAAAAAMVVAGGVYVQRLDVPGRPRLDGNVEVMRSGTIAVEGPKGELAGPPAEFRWLAVQGAVSYRVRLLAVDGVEVWSHTGAGAQVATPIEKVRPGSAYRWDVEAIDVAGRTIARSPLHDFYILPHTRQSPDR